MKWVVLYLCNCVYVEMGFEMYVENSLFLSELWSSSQVHSMYMWLCIYVFVYEYSYVIL